MQAIAHNVARLAMPIVASALIGCSGGGGGTGGPDGSENPGAGDFSINPATELRRIGAATKIALDFTSLFSPLSVDRLDTLIASGSPVTCPGSVADGDNTLTIDSPSIGRYLLDFNECNTTWAVVDGTVEVVQSDSPERANHEFDLTWDGNRYSGKIVVEHDDNRFRIVSDGAELEVLSDSAVLRLIPNVFLVDQENGLSRFDPDAAFVRGPLGTDGGVKITRGFGLTDEAALVSVDAVGSSGAFARVNPPSQGDLGYERLTAGSSNLVQGDIAIAGAGFTAAFTLNVEDQPVATVPGQWAAVLDDPRFTIED